MTPRTWTPSFSGYSCRSPLTQSTTRAFTCRISAVKCGHLALGSRAGKLQYRGYAGQVYLDLTGGYLKESADRGLVFTSAPGGKVYGGDLRWQAPLKGLTVGSSALVQAVDGKGPIGTDHISPFFVHAEYAQFEKGKFYFAGEYKRSPLNV